VRGTSVVCATDIRGETARRIPTPALLICRGGLLTARCCLAISKAEIDAAAPRSGARRLARGTRFLRTPGIRRQLRNPHPEGVSRTPRTLSRVRLFWFQTTGGCARSRSLNPRLISRHASGVPKVDKLESRVAAGIPDQFQ